MENSLLSFCDVVSDLWGEGFECDVGDRIAEALDVLLEPEERMQFALQVGARAVDLFAAAEMNGQVDFFLSMPKLCEAVCQRFVARLSDRDRAELRFMPSVRWKIERLVSRLNELALVKYESEPFNPLRVALTVERQRVVDPPGVEVPAGAPPDPVRLSGLSLLQALPAWGELLPAARSVFVVMYRRAHRSGSAAQPWCQVSVGLLMMATGYKQRQVCSALSRLRQGRWIGYIVRGRPRIGASRYWVATSPDQLGLRGFRETLKNLGFKS